MGLFSTQINQLEALIKPLETILGYAFKVLFADMGNVRM